MIKAPSNQKRPLLPSFDQSWDTCKNPVSHLRLNTFDFSDLWDEEDLRLDIPEGDGGLAGTHTCQINADVRKSIPAPPPLAPPLPPSMLFNCPSPGKERTLRLHWRALQSLPVLPKVSRFGTQTIWAGLEPVHLDTNKLEYLFESKINSSTGCRVRKQQKQKCITVLGVKRSNIITIALSSLAPPRLLPPAIMSMDCCVLDREDLQKLQTLIPSEEELCSIRDAKAQFPDSVLGPAEDCLLTLGRIPHLSQRLQLWAFALDYDSLEREIAEPLFYLKLAMEQLTASHTFRCILATVLAIGNFLNGCKASGFELSYLGKLSQVRDTHSRQPLLHHVCVLLLQLYPRSSDLYSDITAVMRVSKCDYSQVQSNLTQLQSCCKASWEQLHMLERDKGKELWGENAEGTLRKRLPRILKECEERLNVLKAVHRRVINRFHSFLLFLGYPRCIVKETSPEVFCKTVSNFALEYRTSHQTIVREKERENEREGETTASTPQCTQPQECLEHCRLQEVLRTPESTLHRDPSLPRSRRKKGQASSKLK
ncbi:FH1/FH2 domain-containing protein 1 isoform X1 [Paramormyrops kingsleyae]|uniref:FH1/FH2 domain-containing protein 1 isoform X1 n=2 Tax=Paramormyrops kingsleyae TaxID=1676925 RepID=UPI000CD5F151|nr:FH1/FH2 domain-containing protein 3-like isoform X1 [Paramormyrops kingsleyae]